MPYMELSLYLWLLLGLLFIIYVDSFGSGLFFKSVSKFIYLIFFKLIFLRSNVFSETPSSGRGARRSASVRRSASSSRSTSVTPSPRSRARNTSDKAAKETASLEKPIGSDDSSTQEKSGGSKDLVGTPNKPSRSVKESPVATSTPTRCSEVAVDRQHTDADSSKAFQVKSCYYFIFLKKGIR